MPITKKISPANFYGRAEEIASYYGFVSLSEILVSLERYLANKKSRAKIKNVKLVMQEETDRLWIIKNYLGHGMSSLPHPLMIFHREQIPKAEKNAPGAKLSNPCQFSLEIIGVSKSIAEIIIFKTTITILKELGFSNLYIELNSLGDRESISKFTREFNNYYKKNSLEIPTHCRVNIKKDIFKVLSCAQDKCMLAKEHAPKPISTLSESCRANFFEILESMEKIGITYRINDCLVGGKNHYTKTIFEIRTDEESDKQKTKSHTDKTLARGGRYDDLSRQIGHKKELPAVGISISLGEEGFIFQKKDDIKNNTKTFKPKIYLIQLGLEAKLKSLEALEILRKAKIPVCQSLSKDNYSSQITQAEKMDLSYIIIIGQKEAVEDTAIVRNLKTGAQKAIGIRDLPKYLK